MDERAAAPGDPAFTPPPDPATARDHRSEFVVAAGSFTTLIALYLVFAAAHRGTYVMGWYANFIIPVGALLVGMTAASGYGLAAWGTGLKMSRRLSWSVAGQLALSYFIAQYEEFRLVTPADSDLGFWAWFDAATRAFSWKSRGDGYGSSLGVLGYGLRVLELTGFVGGGMLVPLILSAKPYCEPCRTYKRTRTIAVLPAGARQRVFGSPPETEELAAFEAGVAHLNAIFSAARSGDRARLEDEIRTRGPLGEQRDARKHTGHINVDLVRCPRCADGALTASLVQGTGQNIRTTEIGGVDLTREQSRALFG